MNTTIYEMGTLCRFWNHRVGNPEEQNYTFGILICTDTDEYGVTSYQCDNFEWYEYCEPIDKTRK